MCFAALEQGRFLMSEGLGTKLPDDALLRSSCLHSWPYTPGKLSVTQMALNLGKVQIMIMKMCSTFCLSYTLYEVVT